MRILLAMTLVICVGLRVAHAAAEVTVTSTSPDAVTRFKHARELVEAGRVPDAVAELKAALAADPDFALANAWLGSLVAAAEGAPLIDKAAKLAAKLPEAERLMVESIVADTRGDEAQTVKLLTRIVELAPGEWRAHRELGLRALGRGRYDAAVEHALAAAAIAPKAAVIYNLLAYARAGQEKWPEAIAAAKQQVELLPKEANPLDTLGEIQLSAGALEDAEKSFLEATRVDPKFFIAWQGVAVARLHRRDWKGGYAALAKAKEGEDVPAKKLDWDGDVAWVKAAEGKLEEAIGGTAQLEKAGKKARQAHFVEAVVQRAQIYYWYGRYPEAVRTAKAALRLLDKTDFLAGTPPRQRRLALIYQALGLAKLGKQEEAAEVLALLEAAAVKQPANAQLGLAVSWVRGELAAARGDVKAALAELDRCAGAESYPCRFELAQLQEKSGDAAAAAATRAKILTPLHREIPYLFFAARLRK